MLVDAYGREINYLRISVTQRCNFRCLYCMPKIPFDHALKEELLSFEELFIFVRALIDRGVNKIRITGGEPLLRRDLSAFIRMIKDYREDIDLALTSNGFLLKDFAAALWDAGLRRINISLDTLDPKRAKILAQKDILSSVLAGIEEARSLGFKIKLNTVALKGINEGELTALLDFAREKNIQIRFIEFMENIHAHRALRGLKKDAIVEILAQKYPITPVQKAPNAPVSLYDAGGYEFGIIDPHSDTFCAACNRLRLSAEGILIPCLYHDEALSIKEAMQKRDLNKALEILMQVLQSKPEKNAWREVGNEISNRAFYQTGG